MGELLGDFGGAGWDGEPRFVCQRLGQAPLEVRCEMTVQLDYDRTAKTATIVDVVTLIQRFAMSGDYTLEKLGDKFYPQAGRSVNDLELVTLVQSGLVEQAKGMPSFLTEMLQDRASEVVAKLVDDPVVVAAAAETFREVAEAQQACGTSRTVEQTTADLAVWASV